MASESKIVLSVDGVSYAVDGLGNVVKKTTELGDAAKDTSEKVKGWGGIMDAIFSSMPAHVAEGMLLRDAFEKIADVAQEAVMALPHLIERSIESGNSLFEMSLKTGASVEGL